MIKNKTSIVIADDSKFIHKVLPQMLNESENIEFFNAYDGAETLELVSKNKPNILFLDLNMPGFDGIEIISDLAMFENVPSVILMSGEEKRILRSVRDVAAAHGISVLGILSKPFKKEHVEQLIASYDVKIPSNNKKITPLTREDIEKGLKEDRLITMYQPLISLDGGQLDGVEALARWNDPIQGMLPPIEFLHLLDNDQIWHDFNKVMFNKAFEDLSEWLSEGINITLSLNVDIISLNSKTFADDIVNLAQQYKIPPKNITLELTENNVMNDIKIPMTALTRLRMKGFGISIDDFGTGASSLERIRDLPCNELKIDRSFVTNSCKDASLKTILRSSIQIANQLDIKVVAEGIEDEATLELVRELGCHRAQGYSIGRPMTKGQLSNWMLEHWPKS